MSKGCLINVGICLKNVEMPRIIFKLYENWFPKCIKFGFFFITNVKILWLFFYIKIDLFCFTQQNPQKMVCLYHFWRIMLKHVNICFPLFLNKLLSLKTGFEKIIEYQVGEGLFKSILFSIMFNIVSSRRKYLNFYLYELE